MERITSARNPWIARLAELHRRRARLDSGSYLVEGEKMAAEALAHARVLSLLIREDRQEALNGLAEAGLAHGAQVALVAPHALEKISDTVTPQGIVAEVALPQEVAPADLGPRVIVLDGVQDPGNVGTILRTADAVGASGLLMTPACADLYAPKTLRATMGSVFRMPVLRREDAASVLRLWQGMDYAILAAELGAEAFYRVAPRIRPPWALIIGSEAHGVTPELSCLATHHVSLPMRGGAESLNAAIAAGILLYGLTMDREESDPAQPPR